MTHDASMARSTSEVHSSVPPPWDPHRHRKGSMLLDATTESEGGPGDGWGGPYTMFVCYDRLTVMRLGAEVGRVRQRQANCESGGPCVRQVGQV
jgi:hypothetical protein